RGAGPPAVPDRRAARPRRPQARHDPRLRPPPRRRCAARERASRAHHRCRARRRDARQRGSAARSRIVSEEKPTCVPIEQGAVQAAKRLSDWRKANPGPDATLTLRGPEVDWLMQVLSLTAMQASIRDGAARKLEAEDERAIEALRAPGREGERLRRAAAEKGWVDANGRLKISKGGYNRE